jgi:hypothetical protein
MSAYQECKWEAVTHPEHNAVQNIYFNKLYPSYVCVECEARRDRYCNACMKSIEGKSYCHMISHSYSQHDKTHVYHISLDVHGRVYLGVNGLVNMSFLVGPYQSNNYPALFVDVGEIYRLNDHLLLLDFNSVNIDGYFCDGETKKLISQIHNGFTIPNASGNLIVCVDDDVSSILKEYISKREYVCLFCRMEYEKGIPHSDVVYNHMDKCKGKHTAKCKDAISILGSPQS